ncbi:MAG: radical SAM protein [Ruminococcaceae bacterium]|nr:radical SAM protein [Oscillospiraceae bacterium]
MNIIRHSYEKLDILLNPQPLESEKKYRRFTFCVLANVDGKNIAYNALTCELVELEDDELSFLKADFVEPCEEIRELVAKRFLVPIEHDDIQLSDEILGFASLLKKDKGLSSYTIFTTLDCNARCFYCYEKGRPRTPMSRETAFATVDYIKRTNKSGKVRLNWFGGEPLYNLEVIDIITGELEKAGIEYSGHITSNGFLFNDELVEKAVDKWHIDSVQITLDGTEEIYNTSKAYIDCEGKSAFVIVTDNIEKLLKKKVHVTVRVNLGTHNLHDLYKLVDFVADRYEGYRNIKMYAHLLFEYEKNVDVSKRLAEEMIKLEKYMVDKNLGAYTFLESGIVSNHCMADSNSSMGITPTGELTKCEHITADDVVGDIDKGVVDKDLFESFKEHGKSKELCYGCSAYPICIKLKKCPNYGSPVCNEASRMIEEDHLVHRVERTYRRLINKRKKES